MPGIVTQLSASRAPDPTGIGQRLTHFSPLPGMNWS